jgi:putative membrane protein
MNTLMLLATHGDEWGHHGWWPVWPLLWIALIVAAVWFFSRRRPGRFDTTNSAKAILAERFARGELSAEEYRERLGQLG